MSNIGPGIGMVGPAYDYGWCPPFVKLLLSFCMITGRLEIFTVLVLFLPSAWKR
jgi:trk system potassium uptake protein